MKLDDFVNQFSGAAYDEREIAEMASKVEDDAMVRDAGLAFLEALEELEVVLEEIGYIKG